MEGRTENKYVVLNGKNWAAWKFQVSVVLKSKRLYEIVTGEVKTGSDAQKEKDYEDKDCKAQEILITRVDENIISYLSVCNTSSEMWQKLLALYEPSSQVSVHLIQQQFFNLKFEEPMMKFITKIEEICAQLRNLQESPSDKMVITKILLSLPEKYRHFVSAWESVPEKQQNLQELTSRLLIEEERYSKTEPTASTSAFVTRSKSHNGHEKKCFVCGKTGHMKSECRQRKCYSCNKIGHFAKDCNSKFKKCSDKSDKLKAFVVQEPVCKNNLEFIMDSGASDHMSYNRDLFCNFRKLNKQVVVGDGKMLNVEGIGDINFLSFNGSKYVPSVMLGVLFVPDLSANLFSLVNAVDHGYTVLSNTDYCKFTSKGEIVAQAKRVGNLYLMDIKFETNVSNNDSLALVSLSTWHQRMAHQNFKHVKDILSKNDVKYEGQIEQCRSCIEGKQCRLPFYRSDSRAARPGELVHGDLCGPMETKSLGGSSYFLLLKDDYSNYRYVYFLKHKYETKERIAEFLEQFENEFECKVKRFRSDGGGEFMNRDVERLFKMKGIVHEVTVAYTPEQNGRIEREMRTIVESARTMMINAKVGKNLWAEAVNNAVYTINRTGSSSKKGKTPYELLYKKSFDIHTLRTFGDKAYTHIPKQRRYKWDPKAKQGRFVGYGTTTKGYRVWFEEKGEVETFRDITFVHEEKKKHEEEKYNIVEEVSPQQEDIQEEQEEVPEEQEDVPEEQEEVPEEQEDVPKEQEEVLEEQEDVQEEQEEVSEEQEDVPKEQEEVPEEQEDVPKEQEEVLEEQEVSEEHEEVSEDDTEQQKKVIQQHVSEDIESSTESVHSYAEYDDEEYLEEEWFSPDETGIVERRTRSGRRVKKPQWTDDYEVGMLVQGEEELSYEEAVTGKDRNKWLKAINYELKALERNNTWIEMKLPEGKETIDSKWVFKIKKDENTVTYKARLVARGFKQKEKFDHSEVYAPVAKLPTLRILLAISSKYNLEIQQMDVKSAFLNGRIDEEVYLEKPKGMEKDGKVLKLQKSLYGLKKSPRYWNERFNKLMIQEGFIRSKCDYCFYYKQGVKFYVLLYVDDIMLISEDRKEIEKLKEVLRKSFDMKDMNGVSKYLGINIRKKVNSIEIDQENYLRSILKKYNMENCKPVSTPMESGFKIEKSDEKNKELTKRCRELIGSLMYAMLGTRPDICYALSYLSRFQSSANEDVWKGLKRILRYIRGTLNIKLVYKNTSEEPLIGYTDADWGGDQEDRKSTSGYVLKVYGCTVSWSSSKQQCVAMSSTEAEYVSLARGISEGCWVKNLLSEINLKCNKIVIYEDNQSAIHISKNPEQHKRLKHIDLKYHFIRDKVEQKIVILKYIESENQIADICTKALCKAKFERCRNKLF